MVVVVILFARRGVAWRDATVPSVAALLARRWFANYPASHDLAGAFVIVFCSSGGVVATVRGQVATPASSVAFASRDADGLNPGL
jgi:sigma54-dependent transcription regulator